MTDRTSLLAFAVFCLALVSCARPPESPRGDDIIACRLDALTLSVRMTELVGLEHRCCPFLDLELRWPGKDDAPSLVIRSARAKDLITGTFGTAR